MSEHNETIIRVRRRKLLPNSTQQRQLADTLETQRRLWNRCIEERERLWDEYCQARRNLLDSGVDEADILQSMLPPKTITVGDMKKRFVTEARKTDTFLQRCPRRINAATVDRVESNYKTYFTQLKNTDLAPRRPGQKSRRDFNTMGFDSFEGSCMESRNRVRLTGMGSFKIHQTADNRHYDDLSCADIRSCTITRTKPANWKRGHEKYDSEWEIAFAVAIPMSDAPAGRTPAEIVVAKSGSASIDGAPLAINRTEPKFGARIAAIQFKASKLRGRDNRKLGQRNSNRWVKAMRRVRDLHRTIFETRKAEHQRLAKTLVSAYAPITFTMPERKAKLMNRPAARPDAEGPDGSFMPNRRLVTKPRRKRFRDYAWSSLRDTVEAKERTLSAK